MASIATADKSQMLKYKTWNPRRFTMYHIVNIWQSPRTWFGGFSSVVKLRCALALSKKKVVL
jgi:hypothetical protein